MEFQDIVAIILLIGLVLFSLIGLVCLLLNDYHKRLDKFLAELRDGSEGVFRISCREYQQILNSITHALDIHMIDVSKGVLMTLVEEDRYFKECKHLMLQPSPELKCIPVKDPESGAVIYAVSKDCNSNFYLYEFSWKDEYYISWGYTDVQAQGAALAYCLSNLKLD